MKKTAMMAISLILSVLAVLPPITVLGYDEAQPTAIIVNADIPCRAAILIEQKSGRVLFEKQPDEPLPPASVTKVMTLLLVMEALDSGRIATDDVVSCSDHAASMGGSQIWLEPGEKMTVHELLKATAIGSANDAAVALAEHIAGSEESFVAMMNERAGQLGMKNTAFKNAAGLDEEGHLTTARDIAIMSAELLRHPRIKEYSTVWTDSLRNGATELVNTNRLVRFFEGTTGLKTGTTDKAGCCLSASAERNGLSLVAVVLGAENSSERFSAARGLLEYGFANFEMLPVPEPEPAIAPVPVTGGVKREVPVVDNAPEDMLMEKGANRKITQKITLEESLCAPVSAGDRVGNVIVMADGIVVCEYELLAESDVEKMTFSAAAKMFLSEIIRMK